MAPRRGLSKAAGAAGQQTLSLWVRRGTETGEVERPSDESCGDATEQFRERSPRRELTETRKTSPPAPEQEARPRQQTLRERLAARQTEAQARAETLPVRQPPEADSLQADSPREASAARSRSPEDSRREEKEEEEEEKEEEKDEEKEEEKEEAKEEAVDAKEHTKGHEERDEDETYVPKSFLFSGMSLPSKGPARSKSRQVASAKAEPEPKLPATEVPAHEGSTSRKRAAPGAAGSASSLRQRLAARGTAPPPELGRTRAQKELPKANLATGQSQTQTLKWFPGFAGSMGDSPNASSPARESPPKGHVATPCRERPQAKRGKQESSYESPSPDARDSPSGANGTSAETSIKDLKILLTKWDVDFTGCVEKTELQKLWSRFEELRAKPLSELQASCKAAGVRGKVLQSPEDCARHLLSTKKAKAPASRGASAGAGTQAMPSSPGAAAGSTGPVAAEGVSAPAGGDAVDGVRCARKQEAVKEVARILPLRPEAFRSQTAWAQAVLGLSSPVTDLGSVQQAFRTLMRKLHPDRIGESIGASQAMELLREAKQYCERALSQLQPPGTPRHVTSATLCGVPGRRRIRLQWQPPECCEGAPVRRFLVAALDPSYGRALTITILEPEYSEELKRFVSIDELCSFILAEEELQKMQGLFRQAAAVIQVAAANEAGQSAWATLRVPLRDAAPEPAGASAEPKEPKPRAQAGSASESGPKARKAGGGTTRGDQLREFEASARREARKSGAELCAWLRRQQKGILVSWLHSQSWPSVGSKEELVDRVAFAVGASG
eukprot:TRINITY_DN14096_c0_g2_i1.p1 TRINITY_DN14096_c0_g2~~TRINITY_DN14096_c0_g2_i1.p1  ORF type:complete len:793 (-),score=182.60 TRINITY_DN14096_c0_g2_i1:11-2365(-)